MTCGCNTNYPFPCKPPPLQAPSAAYPCKPHFPALRNNFITPAKNSEVNVEFTDTSSFTVGQGILIGSTFYVIKDILNSIEVILEHNGVGATANLPVIAVHPTYSCFQYPITPAGIVTLDRVPTVVGLNLATTAAVASSVTPSDHVLNYGMTGPTSVEFNASATLVIANTPNFVGFSAPIPTRATGPRPTFTALIDEGSGWVPAVALLGDAAGSYKDYIVVGKSGGATLSNGSARKILVSGKYEILV